MWAIRVISGPHAGSAFPLSPGANILGRGPRCQIKLVSPGVSKEHAQIEVSGRHLLLTDLGSLNGTTVNGVKLKTAQLKPGDRIGFHQVLVEILPYEAVAQQHGAAFGSSVGSLALKDPGLDSHQPDFLNGPSSPARSMAPQSLFDVAQSYFERVVMPGVHQLAEWMEFKWVVALLIGTFAVLVTSLSTIPLITILRQSIEEQSQYHAATIATTIARVNEAAIREGTYSAINLEPARRTGVTQAIIILADGKIIAPAALAESYTDIPFVHEARKRNVESIKQVSRNTVVAVHPISTYNPETGAYGAVAFSVVVYDMTRLAVDEGKTISLFVITLLISLVAAAVLFVFLSSLIAHPIQQINQQMDTALRDSTANVHTPYLFGELQKLVSHINSALSRTVGELSPQSSNLVEHDRGPEMSHLVEMMGFPSFAITLHNQSFSAINDAFEQRIGIEKHRLLYQPLTQLSDQAMRLSVEDLLSKVQAQPDQMAINELEIAGMSHQLIAQGVYGSQGVSYALITIIPQEGG